MSSIDYSSCCVVFAKSAKSDMSKLFTECCSNRCSNLALVSLKSLFWIFLISLNNLSTCGLISSDTATFLLDNLSSVISCTKSEAFSDVYLTRFPSHHVLNKDSRVRI